MATKKLPAPRLQLRWEPFPDPQGRGYNWQCHYELVLPLGKYDIRADVYKGDRLLKKKLRELVIPMKEPSVRGSNGVPCQGQNGERYCDTPFRDGAHALWDAKVLGNPPIFVIAPDGMTFEHKEDAAQAAQE
jgi:hypothetical protein